MAVNSTNNYERFKDTIESLPLHRKQRDTLLTAVPTADWTPKHTTLPVNKGCSFGTEVSRSVTTFSPELYTTHMSLSRNKACPLPAAGSVGSLGFQL